MHGCYGIGSHRTDKGRREMKKFILKNIIYPAVLILILMIFSILLQYFLPIGCVNTNQETEAAKPPTTGACEVSDFYYDRVRCYDNFSASGCDSMTNQTLYIVGTINLGKTCMGIGYPLKCSYYYAISCK